MRQAAEPRLASDEALRHNQPNVENWDASGEEGPSKGDQGGDLKAIDHGNIDNSPDVLDRIKDEVLEAVCGAKLCD